MTAVIDTRITRHDLPFVVDSWMMSFRDARAVRRLAPDDYWPLARRVVEACCERATLLVLRPEDEPTGIIAWACADAPSGTLHYAYTKKRHRQQGHASRLIYELGVLDRYTHRRDPFTRFLDRAGFVYDPAIWEE